MEKILRKVVKIFGYENRIKKMLEELAELTIALIHYPQDKVSLPHLVGEIADVEILLVQLKMVLTDKTQQNVERLVDIKKEEIMQGLTNIIKLKAEARKLK